MMQNKKTILGITGGVGAGKSTVLSYLEKWYGARLILCDDVARILQEPGGACYEPMRVMFGDAFLFPDGTFDRKKIAGIVFSDGHMLGKLNAIVHPAVKKWVQNEILRIRENDPGQLIVIEAALLLEEHYDEICDEVWYIYTEEKVRRYRLQKDRGYSDEKITHMIQNQKPDAYFREYCHFTVDNSSDNMENTYEQIDKGLNTHGFL